MLSSITSNLLWFIAGCAGFGAFLDFWIGKKGQKRAKDWLEVLWYRFADVDAHNFAARESERCIEVLDFLVGARLLSWRRWTAALAVQLFALSTFALLAHQNGHSYDSLLESLTGDKKVVPFLCSIFVVVPVVFAASLSLTRYICVTVVRLSGGTALGNVLLFTALLLIHYEILALWGPLLRYAVDIVLRVPLLLDFSPLWQDWKWGELSSSLCQAPSCVLREAWQMSVVITFLKVSGLTLLALYEFVLMVFNIIANGARFLAALVFVCLWLLLPLVHKPLLTLLARIVESDKPVFTLTFGGVAAIAGGIQTVLKHVW